MKNFLKDLIWIIPICLALGMLLGVFSPGTWWVGCLGFFFLLLLGSLAVSALWRSAGASRSLMVMLILTVLLRLGLGIAFSTLLPAYGNDTAPNQNGFAVRDAYSYDREAWQLASSPDSLWNAFNQTYKNANGFDDQYGGLLFFHSLFFRFLSPDTHRPWLLVLMSALAAAIGVALSFKGAQTSWNRSTALIIGWIMALYPEFLLAGASAVREPFLIMFLAMVFWGIVNWFKQHQRSALLWIAGGLLGLLVYSPGITVVALVTMAAWIWLVRKERRINWWWIAGASLLVILAILLLGVILGGALQVPSGPLANLFAWLKYSTNFGAYTTTQNSGWLQTIFASMPSWMHLPFIIAYGIAQPVLPAAMADPAVWPMRVLGILRGLGWYALLPFLLYSLRSILKIEDKRDRLAWLWLWLTSWLWIIVSAARAGGDQWDNPRYRVILILFQAALAAQTLIWQRQSHDRWLGRMLAVEIVFLVLFGYWYVSRYAGLGLAVPHIFLIFSAIGLISAAILIGGWILDRMRSKKKQAVQ